MNEQHEWDWELGQDTDGGPVTVYAFCSRSVDTLKWHEIEDRLNEYEKLRGMLSAEDAEYIGGIIWGSWHAKEKKSQEPMLEDSEMQVRLESAVEREKELQRKMLLLRDILEGK